MGAGALSVAQDLTQLLIARVIVGYAVSFSAVAECVYISEISPASRRGELVSLNELGITVGICLAYLVNSAFITVDGGWRYMFGQYPFGLASPGFDAVHASEGAGPNQTTARIQHTEVHTPLIV